jgi:hypothetical protein
MTHIVARLVGDQFTHIPNKLRLRFWVHTEPANISESMADYFTGKARRQPQICGRLEVSAYQMRVVMCANRTLGPIAATGQPTHEIRLSVFLRLAPGTPIAKAARDIRLSRQAIYRLKANTVQAEATARAWDL